MNDTVSYVPRDGVALLTVDNPPVNAMSRAVRAGLLEGVQKAQADAAIAAIVIRCAGRTFIAGADLKEFDAPIQPPHHHDLFAVLEQCEKPVIAAMHGTALGAGVEMALACHYRCAVPAAKLGLPELTLGIIPGAGGTQRLPRLIGAAQALKFIMDARPVAAADALELGILDRVLEDDLEAGALTYARQLVGAGAGPRVTSRMGVDTTGFDDAFIEQCRQQAARFMRGQHAPERAIEAIRAATELDFEAGLQRETEIGDETLASDESKALRHVFFAEREVTRIPGLDRDIETRAIERVGIVGAGTMGGGIAMNFANIGVPVTILDVSREALDRGLAAVRGNYEKTVARGRLSPEDMEQRLGLIGSTTEYVDLAGSDLVIEAVFEDMALKKKVFASLVDVCRPEAILATNTSTLDINEIAASIPRPGQVLGLHFFSPANVMRLVEIVRGERTVPDVLAAGVDMVKKIRKIGVVVGVCHGFVGNRMMLEGYFREADQLLLEGAMPEQVDRVMYDFGFAMGPCAVNDMAGIDIGYKARLAADAANRHESPYHAAADALAKQGWFGQKTGSGFYRYEKGDRTPHPNPEIIPVIEAEAERFGIRRRPVKDNEIVERCVYSLINAGARILEEGIAYRSGDIDVIWVNGYGFPRYRGGPMFHADLAGAKQVFERVSEFHQRLGDNWAPAPLLKELAQSGGTFSGWSR